MNLPAALERQSTSAGDDGNPGNVAPMAVRQAWFNERYKDWIAEQWAEFEQHGLWNEKSRQF